MHVEHDESMKPFRIFRFSCDPSCNVAPCSSAIRFDKVISDGEFKVIGEFGERLVFDAAGRLIR